LAGRTIGDIGDPGLVRARGDKRLGQDILRHRQHVRRIRRGREPAHLLATEVQFLAEPLNAPNPGGEAVRTQFRLEALRALRVPGTHMGRLDRHF
jgi:hypothetical protein